ncbi:MAG: DNA repair protein RecO [Persicimonas sp.]
MSKPRRTPAFILRRVEYGEKDLIVTVLGRDTGKFSAIAKAARASKKRFGGGLQPMRCLELRYSHKSGRDLAFLREIDVLEDYAGLEGDFERITVGSYATELVREVCREGDAEPPLFDLLRAFYRRLAEADAAVLALESVLHDFELSLLELHGALPSLHACFRCGKAAETLDKLRCIRSGQGLLCNRCRRAGEAAGVIDPETLELLHYFERPGDSAPAGLTDSGVLAQARRVIDASFRQVLDQPLKSRPMLETVLEGALAG